MGTLCGLFVSKHVSVSLLFVNKRSWSFVCQFIIDMLFAPSHNDTVQFVKFHHYTLRATCNSLDWVTCYPLHFTLAYIVYRESRTCQVVYIHVHYGVRGEMYIGIDSHLIDLSLCYIICSQIKKIGVLVAKPELLISCHPNERQSVVFSPSSLKIAFSGGLCKIRAVWTVCHFICHQFFRNVTKILQSNACFNYKWT